MQQAEVPEIIARIMDGRAIDSAQSLSYLTPTLKHLMPKPDSFADMAKGAERISRAIMSVEKIGIIGDYDVDGVTSTAMLVSYLQAAGAAETGVHIPHRVDEGYGPNNAAITSLQQDGAQVLVTLDCGVMAHDPIAHASELGMECVIVDHHQATQDLPNAYAVINPNRQDDLSGQGHLCAAGVTFILLAALNRVLRQNDWWSDDRPEPDLLNWLDLAALGTVCDVVPLKGVNRAFVVQGLKVMARRNRLGLAALADNARLKRKPDVHALGFVLGPRINAAGRVGHAKKALDLVLATEHGQANILARELEELNHQRQAIELEIVEQAQSQAQAAMGDEQNLSVLVVSGPGWHPGVLGLVASRLKEHFHRPAFALSWPKDGDTASGSGRSIAGVDLGQAVQDAVKQGVIVKGGGHAMAAGLSVKRDNIGALRGFLEDALNEQVETASAEPVLHVDGAVSASGMTISLINLIEQAGPYGAGHPAPIFALPAHRVVYADRVGTDHVRCTLAASDGSRIKAIAFRALHTELGETLLSERSNPLHIAGRVGINDWNGKREAQLFIDDVAIVT